MILARSGNDANCPGWGALQCGIEVVGAAVMSAQWVPTLHHGLLLGSALGISVVWFFDWRDRSPLDGSWFCSAFVLLFGSSNQSIWLSKVEPALQAACSPLVI